MMTPEQERALLTATVAGLDDDLRAAFAALMGMIQAGTPPRDAVDVVMQQFSGEMAETMSVAMTAILEQAVGTAAILEMQVSQVRLSVRLYAEAQATGEVVHGIVQSHVSGFVDARRLALELFEGYGFRLPGTEPLQMNPGNDLLPRYLREALLPDDKLRSGFAKAFADIQVDNLTTPALNAAYKLLLAAIDDLEAGRGEVVLEKKIEMAWFERMRYFAERIARTELHRAYAEREALLLLDDDDVEFVQIRRAPGKQLPCICSLITGRDLYGLGPGVYPKREAPVPTYHPFCQCIMSPRLDLTGRKAKPRDAGGDAYFLLSLAPRIAARVMGSKAKRAKVLAGASAETVANAGRDPQYWIKTAGEL